MRQGSQGYDLNDGDPVPSGTSRAFNRKTRKTQNVLNDPILQSTDQANRAYIFLWRRYEQNL